VSIIKKQKESITENTRKKKSTKKLTKRELIYSVIQTDRKATSLYNKLYNAFMIITIAVSILPCCFKSEKSVPGFLWIERITFVIFSIDYIVRWFTADLKYKRFGTKAFAIYPFRFHAVIDLIALLPGLFEIIPLPMFHIKALELIRIFRIIRCVRVFKTLKYSSSFNIISKILKKQKNALLTVLFIALAYIFISAIFMYQIEPDTFQNFFEAIYWPTISLTTVGYGDIYPVTTIGRIVTMVSSIFGIAIVALPSGIITAGYMNEIHRKDKEIDNNCEE